MQQNDEIKQFEYCNYIIYIDEQNIEAHHKRIGHRWCATEMYNTEDTNGNIISKTFHIKYKENVPEKIILKVKELAEQKGYTYKGCYLK